MIVVPASANCILQWTAADALLPVLKEELIHLSRDGVLVRTQEVSIRATCGACLQFCCTSLCTVSCLYVADVCQTSIFSGSWICRTCGKEVCSDCYATITACKLEDPDMFARPIVDSVQRNHHYCTMRQAHFASHFSPVSRFDKLQLESEAKAMDILLASSALLADVSEPEIPYVLTSSPLGNFPTHRLFAITDLLVNFRQVSA